MVSVTVVSSRTSSTVTFSAFMSSSAASTTSVRPRPLPALAALGLTRTGLLRAALGGAGLFAADFFGRAAAAAVLVLVGLRGLDSLISVTRPFGHNSPFPE